MELCSGLSEEAAISSIRLPLPMDSFSSVGLSEEDVALMRASFDADYYRETCPDIAANNLDPLEHFCLFGWKENRDPAAWFSTHSYLLVNQDVKAAGENPFLHYLRYGRLEERQIIGRLEGRQITPVDGGKVSDAPSIEGLSVEDVALIRASFDADYYRETYPDIAANNLDPLEHFCLFGWKENRDPAAWFSVQRYRAAYSDVIGNPFIHYLAFGRAEKRRIWPARFEGPCEIDVDPDVSLVDDQALRALTRFSPSSFSVRTKRFDPKRLQVHWVIPDFTPGSGGHMTIFRMIRWLEIFGHECSLWITNRWRHKTAEDAYDTIVKHFQTVRASVHLVGDDFVAEASGDCIVATSWDTVPVVVAATAFAGKFYFVQDFEPSFYSTGSHSLSAEMSYKQEDLACICASPWLSQLLSQKYGRWARHFWLGYDQSIYRQEGPEARGASVPRIALYARISTARRVVELAFLALELLAERGVKFHVDFFGQDLSFVSAKFPGTLHGVLSSEQLASLYRRADIGICFSATNYSLVPQEMMACGLPIVELDTESTRAIFPDEVVTRAVPSPSAIADAIEGLLASPARRKQQAVFASEWVSQFDWEASGRIVESALIERLTQLGHKAKKRSVTTSKSRSPKVSVCIPTYNGGDLLIRVIEKILAQRTPWAFEVVVVDSSSKDGSFEKVSRMPGVYARQIPQVEFGHGKTRNFAASLSKGEYIAFLTQDALPVDDNWLYNLVAVLEHFPRSAGAFGRHIAYPDASPFTKRDLATHFDGFSKFPLAVSQRTDQMKWEAKDVGWRQFLHFYSDNNSCMKRTVWENVPYPDIEFGEDQAWADAIINSGFEKVYAPGATVFHSHDFVPAEADKRSNEEATFFRKYFGYCVYDRSLDFESQLKRMNDFDRIWAKQKKIDEETLGLRLADNEARLRGMQRGAIASPIIFMHVTKTAGGSLKEALATASGLNPFFAYEKKDIEALVQKDVRDMKMIYGHVVFGLHEKLGVFPKYACFVRDPVRRTISHYYHLRNVDESEAGNFIRKSADIDDFFQNFSYWEFSNLMAKVISGFGDQKFDSEEILFSAAKKNIDNWFTFVGFQEHFSTSVRRLSDILGTKLEIKDQVNVGEYSYKEIANSTIDKISALNKVDVALYEYCLKKFL